MSNNEIMSIDDQTLTNIMNKRHRSAKSSQFKNPPQPKFCIKEKTSDEKHEVFINVLSYSRIANQLSEFDPIPLYGGMSIKSAANIQQHTLSSQLIFAVMASPEVLKKTGRNCTDLPEQMNLVELMCEFVEAMNPSIVLSKKPEILQDRDLAGELKDVWSAVQNFREKEKAGIALVVYTEFGPDSAQDSIMKSVNRNEISNNFAIECEDDNSMQLNNYPESSNRMEKIDAADNCENTVDTSTPDKGSSAEKCSVVSNSVNIEMNKLALEVKKEETMQNESHHNNEKILKLHNQKNKESQHTFFPKFLTSSKEKESKEKEKEKDEQEPKKTKKSLNFFRRSKSSTCSPTHVNSNPVNTCPKSDSLEN